MRRICTIIAAAALSGVPASAADLHGAEVRTGAFLGARLRLPLDGGAASRPEAALTLAPTQTAGGGRASRFGEGVALDFAGRSPTLKIGGIPADLALGIRREGSPDAKHKLGISTTAWVAIGALVAVGAVLVVTQLTCIGEDPDYCGSD